MIRPRVGLLVPYVSFYETIVPLRGEKIAFAGAISEKLRSEFDIVDGGLITTEEEGRQAGKTFAGKNLDAVVVAPAVATFGALAWAALRELSLPVCLWQVQPDCRLQCDYDIAKLIRNSGSLGIQALANTLMREGHFFRVGFSCFEDPFPPKLKLTVESAAVWNALRRARLGRIGSPFEQMTDVALNASKWLGAPVTDIPSSEILHAYQAQSATSVAARETEIVQSHEIVELTEDELSRSARLSLALDVIVNEYQLDGGAFNCHGANCLQNPAIGVTACYAVSRHTSGGCPFSCTGDLPTAIAMKILQDLSGWVLYAELDFVDRERNLVLLANGGEGNFGAPTGPVVVAGNENFRGQCGRGASLRFEPFRGPATILSFTPRASDKCYRMIAAEGTLEASPPLQIGVFHAAFRFNRHSAVTAYEGWCEAGAVHHLALAPGHWVGHLEQFALQSGFELVVVGGSESCD
ncbi:MAG: hypothetical protein JOY85_25280 [Acidobacteriaceae bacterium]|nr:hypothetical protein [Acidobacteriaceae bacterium]